MSEYRNNVAATVSGTPGTGTITLGAAVAGAQGFSAAYGANATVDVFITDGAAWEVARNCTYTHSGTTLTRGTLEASSTGSALILTSAAVVRIAASADTARRWDGAALEQSTVSGTSGAITAEVNRLYVADMSGWTADRTLTLPAVAAVGDRVGMMVQTGDDLYEWLVQANTGDTLNGVTAAEWSRVFITGETVIFRCVVANTAWVVEQDGRIAQRAKMHLSTSADGESAGTYTRPTTAPTAGVWTSTWDNASINVPASDRIAPRRAGNYQIVVAYVPKDTGSINQFANLEIRRNGSVVLGGPSTSLLASGVNRITAVVMDSISVGDYFDYWYRTEIGGLGALGTLDWTCTIAVEEIL